MVGSVIGDTSDTDLRVCETRLAPPQVVVAPRSKRSGHDTMAADLPALLFQIQSWWTEREDNTQTICALDCPSRSIGFFSLFPPHSATRSILHALITSSTQCSFLPHPQSLAGFSRAGVRVPRYPVSSPCPSRSVNSSILSITQVHSRLPTLFTGNLRVTVEYSSVSTLRRSTFSTSGDGRRGRGVKRVVSTSSILAR